VPARGVALALNSRLCISSTAPTLAPANLQRRATVAALPRCRQQSTPRALPSGAICGDPAISSRAIPAIAWTLAGCVVANPVRLRRCNGITVYGCERRIATAQALSRVTKKRANPGGGQYWRRIAQLRVVAH